MKNELLISGVALQPQEIEELQFVLQDDTIEVHVLETKGLVDLVQVVFNDFNAIGFTRDLIIGAILSKAYAAIKPVVEHLKRRSRVNSICIEKNFITENQTPFTLYVVSDAAQFEQLLTQLDSIPKEQLTPQGKNSVIMIRYDQQGHLEITDMGQ